MSTPESLICRFGDFELDEANARLRRGQDAIDLPPKALAVLCTLVRQPNRLVTKNTLLDAVWGHRHISDSVLRSTISQLRTALGDDTKQPRFIETAARRGYRFIAPPPEAEVSGNEFMAEAVPLRQSSSKSAVHALNFLVGRSAALERLNDFWAEGRDGVRQIVWVTGEAGIGKSSVVDAFSSMLGDTICVRGRCVEPYGSGEPYLPLLEAVGELCRRDDAMPNLLRQYAPTWLLQMPWLQTREEAASLRNELSGSGQDRMLREMGELLDRYTEQTSLLVLIEDMHWSDASTVRWIDHLARRRSRARFMLIGTFRPAEVIALDHPLKHVRHELRANHLCHEIMLEPLSEKDVFDYIAQRHPEAPASDALATSLHAHTDGLPLFMVNLFDDLVQRGSIDGAQAGRSDWIDRLRQGEVPSSLAGVIERQFDRLDAGQQRVLSAASVVGMTFSQQIVADALRCPIDDVADALEALAQTIWIEHRSLERLDAGTLNATYVFRHALYRRVLYGRIGAGQRAEWHHRIAMSLSRLESAGEAASPAERAMHFERGRDLMAAASCCVEAAESALAHFAPVEALRHSEHGLQLLAASAGSAKRRPLERQLLMSSGVAAAQLHGVASAEARDALERARKISDETSPSEQRTWLLNGSAWVCFARGEFERAKLLARDILDEATSADDGILQLCGANLMGATHCYSGDLEEAGRWLEQALALALKFNSFLSGVRSIVDLETSVRVYLAQVFAQIGQTKSAMAQSASALARAESVGQPMSLTLAYRCLCMLQIRLGLHERAAASSQSLSEIVERHAVEQSRGPSLWYRGWTLALSGDIDRGHQVVMEGYERQTASGMRAGCALARGYAAEILAMKEDWQGAKNHIEHALELAGTLSETVEAPHLLLLRASLLRGQCEDQAARNALRDAIAAARANHAHRYHVAALCAACEFPGAGVEDLHALRSAIVAVPDGFDEPLRRRALAIVESA